MIDANEFKERWNEKIFPLVKYTNNKVDILSINKQDKEFLLAVGLPDSAAPFLSFVKEEKGALKKLKELYDIQQRYGDYVYLGYNASGDLIVLNEESGEVLCINHENSEEQYVNKSIVQLAESLLEYASFVNHINQVRGDFAYLDRECAIEDIRDISNRLKCIDSEALKVGSFWSEEIEQFS